MWYDCRVPRSSRLWSGLLLGTGCLVGSPCQLAAMSIEARPSLPGWVLIQAQPEPGPVGAQPETGMAPRGAAETGSFTELHEALAAARERLEELSKAAEAVASTGQLRQDLVALKQENQELIDEIATLQSKNRELEGAARGAEARVAELSAALEEATARARQIDEELVAVRWENAQLNTSLAQTRAARKEDQEAARQSQDTLRARVAALEAGGEDTAAQLTRLREQAQSSRRELTIANDARAQAEAQLAELRDRLDQAETASTRVDEVERQLRAAKEEAASARQDLARTVQVTAALERERDELRARLTTAEQANDQLHSEVAALREAAGSATQVARQNLIAVENQIRELNEALRAAAPDAGAVPAASASAATEGRDKVAAETPANDGDDGAATEGETVADLADLKSASAQHPASGDGAGTAPSELPLEQRLHVEGLLADLSGTKEPDGLKMVVPGGVLFAVNSEDIQEGAYDTLAKVAELIDIYDGRKVHIVGHTDALGDSGYNKTLSERRAELVKRFFVDEFDIDEARLSTEGQGEARPIASNATQEGRRANRRVEVLILN
jgi:outer membrane protein OmpA-like peptidoglycan-associated protein/regulator of replication initiation timing